jgi:hypothetical protein
MQHITRRVGFISIGLLLIASHIAHAAEIRVITSGAFTEAYKQLIPIYEQASGHKSSARMAHRLVMRLTLFPVVLRAAKNSTWSSCLKAA